MQEGTPKPVVSPLDAAGIIIGIVIGAGIFRFPSIVAGNAASTTAIYFAWISGGVISLLGAFVYAELAAAYPGTGGDYYFLRRAFGDRLAFLFGWSRMTVIQTGSIVTVSLVAGDFLSQLLSLGKYSSAVYAAVAIIILTVINIAGVRQGTGTQNILTAILILGMLVAIGSALFTPSPQPATATTGAASTSFGALSTMMLFVLFTYGGWNEAAYVSGELRNVQRNMAPVLVSSILLITGLYVGMNWAYLHVLGLSGVAGSQGVAADLMKQTLGQTGAKLISILVAIAALTTANATVFTGGRSSYALGRDFRGFGFLGRWNAQTGTPLNGLLLQGVIALALVILGVATQQGFQAIVEYTAPVFWFFFLCSGIAFFVLRGKDPTIPRPFRVPLYPVPPILFCLTCGYLLYSSVAFLGKNAFAGVAVLLAGAVLLLFVRPSNSGSKP